MAFKSHFFTAAALVSFMAFTAISSAQAGQLFPPANIGAQPNAACPNGYLLDWTGQSVECTNPTPGVTVSCANGTVMTGILNGVAQCTNPPVSNNAAYTVSNISTGYTNWNQLMAQAGVYDTNHGRPNGGAYDQKNCTLASDEDANIDNITNNLECLREGCIAAFGSPPFLVQHGAVKLDPAVVEIDCLYQYQLPGAVLANTVSNTSTGYTNWNQLMTDAGIYDTNHGRPNGGAYDQKNCTLASDEDANIDNITNNLECLREGCIAAFGSPPFLVQHGAVKLDPAVVEIDCLYQAAQ